MLSRQSPRVTVCTLGLDRLSSPHTQGCFGRWRVYSRPGQERLHSIQFSTVLPSFQLSTLSRFSYSRSFFSVVVRPFGQLQWWGRSSNQKLWSGASIFGSATRAFQSKLLIL